MNIFIGIIVFIFGLGIVICLHEAGHFSMAKLFKVYCEEFSIGFGPKLISINPKDPTTGKKRWETTLNIRLLPLGGYVAMVSEEEDSALTEAGQQPIPPERTFSHINRGKQAIIMIAGIAVNLILSYFLFLLGNAFGRQQDPYTSQIRVQNNSPLYEAGVRSGDYIDGLYLDLGDFELTADGRPDEENTLKVVDGNGRELTASEYQSLSEYIDLESNRTARVTGDAALVDTTEPYQIVDDFGSDFNFYNIQEALKISLNDSEKNLKVGEDGSIEPVGEDDPDTVILRYAPIDASAQVTMQAAYHHSGSEQIFKTENVAFSAVESTVTDEETGEETTTYSFPTFGLGCYMTYMPDPDSGRAGSDWISPEVFGQAIVQSFVNQGLGIRDVYVALGSLFTPKGWNSVGGIVSIFMTNQQAVDLGFYYVMWVWGLISVNLAVLNLLPIPGLDGWQLLLCIIEAIRRKPISSKFKGYASIVGLSAMLILAAVLIILDCIRYFA